MFLHKFIMFFFYRNREYEPYHEEDMNRFTGKLDSVFYDYNYVFCLFSFCFFLTQNY